MSRSRIGAGDDTGSRRPSSPSSAMPTSRASSPAGPGDASSSKAPAIIVPRRALVRPDRDVWHYDVGKSETRIYERGRNPLQGRLFSFPQELRPRAGYQSASSAPIGLHYSGPRVAGFTREIFTAPTGVGIGWNAPVAVADFLMVGGGGGGIHGPDDSGGIFAAAGGGGGGGGVVVQVAVPLTLGNPYLVFVGVGGTGDFNTITGATVGGPSLIQQNFAPFATLVIGGGGGVSGGLFSPGGAGQPSNGNGAGGGASPIDGAYPPTAPDGAGFLGGAGALGAVYADCGGGGGGGAGAVGGAAIGGSPASPGAGGAGAIPPPHSFGAWGVDIGENGFFSGGGGGRNGDPAAWTVGAPGVGNGADNTGGGGGPTAPPLQLGENGRSGIAVIVYATP